VSFDAHPDGGVAGGPATVTWDFGDGSTGSGATTTHAYAAAGTYAAVVTVTDGFTTATATRTVTVHAPTCSTAPTAGVIPAGQGTAGADPQVQLSAACQEFIRAGADGQTVLSPAGKDWYGYSAHTSSPSCGAPGPGVKTLECEIKPDGTVCWHLYGQPDLAAGDQIIFRIRRNGVIISEVPVTVVSSSGSVCTP
jgi:PKD repeat protein